MILQFLRTLNALLFCYMIYVGLALDRDVLNHILITEKLIRLLLYLSKAWPIPSIIFLVKWWLKFALLQISTFPMDGQVQVHDSPCRVTRQRRKQNTACCYKQYQQITKTID